MPVNHVRMTHNSQSCNDDSCQSLRRACKCKQGLVCAMALALTPAVLECWFESIEQQGFPALESGTADRGHMLLTRQPLLYAKSAGRLGHKLGRIKMRIQLHTYS